MAKIELKNSTSLSVEELLEKLELEFSQRKGYQTYTTALWGADIVIRKSAFVGVSIKLKQKSNKTSIRVTGMIPSAWGRLLSGLWMVFLIGKWNKLIKEVNDFATTERFHNSEMELGQEEDFS